MYIRLTGRPFDSQGGGGGVGLAFYDRLIDFYSVFRVDQGVFTGIICKIEKKTTNTQTLGGDGLGPTGKCLNLFSKTESNPCI